MTNAKRSFRAYRLTFVVEPAHVFPNQMEEPTNDANHAATLVPWKHGAEAFTSCLEYLVPALSKFSVVQKPATSARRSYVAS